MGPVSSEPQTFEKIFFANAGLSNFFFRKKFNKFLKIFL